MRDVVRGDKHNLRKSANSKAQISTLCGVNDTDLCVAILQIFSGCVCRLEQRHAQSPFLFPIAFRINSNTLAGLRRTALTWFDPGAAHLHGF